MNARSVNFTLSRMYPAQDGTYDSTSIDASQSDLLEKISHKLSLSDTNTDVLVLTDRFEYQEWDQVIPIQPEQLFFYDELQKDKIKNARVLEIGVGSGVLSIKAAKQGAEKVVALDINPKARNVAGFNATLNGVQDILDIRHGDTKNIFAPVQGETFDYIISNPPFEPTPEDTSYYLNSAAGIYGLDFLDAMFRDLNTYLAPDGYLQIVTMAPGSEQEPFLLTEQLKEHFPDQKITINLDHQPIGYDTFVDRFVDIFDMDKALVDNMKSQAAKDGVTHIHMCMIHFVKGESGPITFEKTPKLYENWTTPLGKAQD